MAVNFDDATMAELTKQLRGNYVSKLEAAPKTDVKVAQENFEKDEKQLKKTLVKEHVKKKMAERKKNCKPGNVKKAAPKKKPVAKRKKRKVVVKRPKKKSKTDLISDSSTSDESSSCDSSSPSGYSSSSESSD